jgi:glycosyltransferase involved in cell wall biosynthesis
VTKRILVLIGRHLSTAPRAQKEALALMEAGHDVEVGGVWCDERATAEDEKMMARTGIRFAPALDFRAGSWRRSLRRLRVRLRGRWARDFSLRTGDFSPALLGYGARELLAAAEKKKADLTIVHSEAGLWVARNLLRRGYRIGVDFEDWFSRDVATAGRPAAMLEEMEREVARGARYVLAPSRAMARALAAGFSILPPEVIYNSFPFSELDGLRKDRSDAAVVSVHWFSQHIGPSRGLELLFAALPLLRSQVEIYLRGACSKANRRWLDAWIPGGWRQKVTILPPVSSTELPSRIAEHDIGLALETATITNRDLTVSNKVFQYLQAGLAVIATDTRGQREVLGQCGEASALLAEPTPRALAEQIDWYVSRPDLLARSKEAARAAAKIFCWEEQKGTLIKAAARAILD